MTEQGCEDKVTTDKDTFQQSVSELLGVPSPFLRGQGIGGIYEMEGRQGRTVAVVEGWRWEGQPASVKG